MATIHDISNTLHQLEVTYSQLSWVAYTTGFDQGVNEAYEAIVKHLENKAHYDTILKALEGEVTPKEKRELMLLKKEFQPFHQSEAVNALQLKISKKQNELMQVINTHRSVLNGREISSVEIQQILTTEEDREKRKAAYMAYNQINEPLYEAGFLDLINMRKELASLNGFKDFVDYKLDECELEPTLFDSWREELNELLPEIKKNREDMAKKYLKDTVIYPWDEAYVLSKIAPTLNTPTNMTHFYTHLVNFFDKFGIDLTSYNITYDVFPRTNKSEWGYNFPIETGKDSRILANVKDKYNEYNVLLHETGHGIHSFLLSPDDIMLNRGVSGIISEGIANLFQGFITDKLFYDDLLSQEGIEEEFHGLKAYNRLNRFRDIFRILFDQEFYRSELTSLHDIYGMYWRIYKELFDEEPFMDTPPWAYIIHFTSHPIYLHNYFMGDVTCAMLKKVFKKRYGVKNVADNPKAFGEFLKDEVISPSGRYPYGELFERISGEKFRLSFLLES
ncbi:M2 family metallopeptidase [Vallitalea pronyensis]|uniref:M2 family metallopeptidase n=1 Tax=Vallitalea pronyensis TaxID=1348613 RepID=A0A8J8MH27_9FIRM|nr:M3 family metallopeptidase [Vallitalea pronyensis]QUI21198.1 M2 family metallopeptidase [Vallitalea pronyensis]